MSKAYVKAAAAYLRSVPLLAKLTTADREKLAQALKTKSFKDGQVLIREGDNADGFFIVLKGEVVVTRGGVEMCVLGDGDYFGETALLTQAKRSATVTAKGNVDVFFMETVRFNAMFGDDRKKLNVAFAHRAAVSAEASGARLDQLNYVKARPSASSQKKTDAQATAITKAISTCILFFDLSQQQKQQIVDSMYMEEVKSGTAIIKEGAQGDFVYVVETGAFDVTVKGNKVATRSAGSVFGELALMYNAPRAATVTATADSVVWVLDRFTFRRVVTELTQRKYRQYCDFLRGVQLLAPLHEYEREKIAEALEEVHVQAGATVIKQGTQGHDMYIVREGELLVKKDDKEVKHLKKGDYFGELALIRQEPRAATVTVIKTAELLKLDRSAFNMLLGPLQGILDQGAEAYDEAEKKMAAMDLGLEDKTDHSIQWDNLVVLGTLGRGSFGHVRLVRDKTTQKTYALKAVSKKQIVETGQQGHIMSEKRVMAAMDHPFMIKLHATFKDKNRLYFLLEPILGGELFTVLRRATLFDEPTARFYAACVVLAFEEMHSHNVIYRDLKPENLLIGNNGYLKVTDFGFAKVLPVGQRTWTLCGTPDYLAPEIVAGKGHGKGVDWWTLGILVYEMLASYPPFYDEDPMNTYRKILKCKVHYPSHFSKDAQSLIRQLLHPKATRRLGVVRGGAALIKKHAWFKGFDWEALIKQTTKAPLIPKIKNDTDLSNFLPEDDTEHIPEYNDDGTGWDADF